MHAVLVRQWLVLFALCVLGVAGCSSPTESTANSDAESADTDRLTVVGTVGMVTDVIRNVAGDRVEVVGLINPGIDPHLFKPTRSDIEVLLRADAIFMNGLRLEGQMTEALSQAEQAGTPVHVVTELLDESSLLDSEDYADAYDPHVWMDPAAWARGVEVIRDQLTELDPDGASVFAENAEAYLKELRAMDEYAVRVLESVPESSRVLITAHDAFNYFGARFGYEVVGIQGISTESEAGLFEIEQMVSMLVTRQIGAVFVESTVSDRNVKKLIRGAEQQGHAVAIGGELFSDAMGDAGTYEGTYVGMIDHNVTTIARALGGEAPERGMQGKLGVD